MSNLTKTDVRQGLEKLADLWPRRIPDNMVETFFNILVSRGMDVMQFRDAVHEYCGSDETYFPKPYSLVRLAKSHAVAHSSDGGGGRGEDRCPSCRQVWYYAGWMRLDGVVAPRLRCGCERHYRSERWQCAEAKAWQESP